MLLFEGVKSSCQISLPRIESNEGALDNNRANKWQRSRADSTSLNKLEEHRVFVSKRFVFATSQNSLVIHDCNPKTSRRLSLVADYDSDSESSFSKELVLTYAASPLTCVGIEEESETLCTCSDETVHFVRKDSILGDWEALAISEGEGKILSCCVSVKGHIVWIVLFKSDALVVYRLTAIHDLSEPGPLILESYECVASLEKRREPTTFCKSFVEGKHLRIISVSSGNAASVMLWELSFETNELRLIAHQTVRNTKSEAACDAETYNGNWYTIVMNPEGYGEIFLMKRDGFILINRLKVEDTAASESPIDHASKDCNNSIPNQAEFRILGAKFFFQKEESKLEDVELNEGKCGEGDAKPLSLPELDNSLGEPSSRRKAINCPTLIVAVATSRKIYFIDAISGEVELSISYEELLKEEGIFVQHAKMAQFQNDFLIALQPCLTRMVFHRSLGILVTSILESSKCSLVPQEILSTKSVLRKKMKSPPREESGVSMMRGARGGRRMSGPRSRYLPVKPAWARSRSRPSAVPKKLHSSIDSPLMSARGAQFTVPSGDVAAGGLPSARPLKIHTRGTYQDTELHFSEGNKVSLDTRLSEGLSYLRIAANRDGKLLAVGGSASPLIITKTQPFETIRRLKDVAKITSLYFSFNSDLLLMASNDGKTTMIHWQNTKELLNFDFNSKFNEHLHSQFYFMDKFILQPEENKIVLYSYARRENGFIKLQAGSYTLNCQSITALAAANQFYSNQIICGLSNKIIQVFDTNAEQVSLTINQGHGKAVSCIRLNEAPKGQSPTDLCDIFMTSSVSNIDPIKLWDLRSARCILRISDTNPSYIVPSTRPSLSPCGRYIASGFEDNSLVLYDIRNIKSRLLAYKGLKSSVLDCSFDTNLPMIWCGCRNGTFWNLYTK